MVKAVVIAAAAVDQAKIATSRRLQWRKTRTFAITPFLG